MKRGALVIPVLVGSLTLSTGFVAAADQDRTMERERLQIQEQVYGSQMMTEQEREEYRAKMRAAKTAEEQEQIRREHHERMKERAKERGVVLPDEPPERGGGMGPGGGMMPRGGRNR